ncbi:MAG: hypothetical protein Q8Q65_00265 [bacterium]|nr:hypothetical protein [bacterium]
MAPHVEALAFLTNMRGIGDKRAESYAKAVNAWTTGEEPSDVDTVTLLDCIRAVTNPKTRLFNAIYSLSGSVNTTEGIVARYMRKNIVTQLQFNDLAEQYKVEQYNMEIPKLDNS